MYVWRSSHQWQDSYPFSRTDEWGSVHRHRNWCTCSMFIKNYIRFSKHTERASGADPHTNVDTSFDS